MLIFSRGFESRWRDFFSPGPDLQDDTQKLKFHREKDDDWVLEDKFEPVHDERKTGQGVIEILRDTKTMVWTGIDRLFFQNAYPVTVVAYGLYSVRDQDPANLAPLRDGEINNVVKRVVDVFKGALRGQELTLARRRKIQVSKERNTKLVQP